MNQEPYPSNFMPDTFVNLGETSYGASIEDYQAQMGEFERLQTLAHYLRGRARTPVESLLMVEAEGCYEEAWDILNTRFG